MIIQLTASADTYITNKVINHSFSASDANVGRAGTIDIFKLYDEASLPWEAVTTELSRGLIKFDMSRLQELTATALDYSSSNFRAELILFDVNSGLPSPSDFTISVFPLLKKWDEGNGRDVAGFRDIDVANWLTASFSLSASLWGLPGASSASYDFDQSYERKQTFIGHENLCVDVTPIVSGILAGAIENNGFRLSITSSQEADQKTYFVKRFASRHVKNELKRPLLRVSWADYVIDDQIDFRLNLTGSLFLNSFERGAPANIKSGSAFAELSGDNCMSLLVTKDSFSKTVSVSQRKLPGSFLRTVGVYQAQLALFGGEMLQSASLLEHATVSGSIEMDTFWKSNDGTVCFFTGSLIVKAPDATSFNQVPRILSARTTNCKKEYSLSESPRLRVFVIDNAEQPRPSKYYFQKKSVHLTKVYYSVIDTLTGEIVIPFMELNDATRLSCDSEGLYFDLDLTSFVKGRAYSFAFKAYEGTASRVFIDNARFKVV